MDRTDSKIVKHGKKCPQIKIISLHEGIREAFTYHYTLQYILKLIVFEFIPKQRYVPLIESILWLKSNLVS